MASFSEEITNALENVIEAKVQERCQGLIAENTRLFAEKQELGNQVQNLKELNDRLSALSAENDKLREVLGAKDQEIYSLRETLYRVMELMAVLEEEFGDLERNVGNIESSIGELQRELEEEDD